MFGKLDYKLYAILALVLLQSCNSGGGGYKGNASYSVGPDASFYEKNGIKSSQERGNVKDLSILIVPFDPNLPNDTEDYAKKNIWPELRRAEANRFAVQTRDAITDTNVFEIAQVSPTKNATAHFYLDGKIVESNGAYLSLSINLVSIDQRKLITNKKYKHEVKDYDLNNPRNEENYDLYKPLFQAIAKDVAKAVSKLSKQKADSLKIIEELRFAETFSPEYFSKYLDNSSLITKIKFAPSDDDKMLQRIRALRIRDKMFIDSIQSDYDKFSMRMAPDYLNWQRGAYLETKAAEEARRKSLGKKLLGLAAITGGIALAATADPYSTRGSLSAIGGTVVAGAGIAGIASSFEDSADAKMYESSLSELGSSLNIELAPRVIEMENKNIEFKGDASEQYIIWRKYLFDLYELEKTPDIIL